MRELREEFRIVPVSEQIALQAGRLNAALKSSGTPIGVADVLIAATAFQLGFGVLTHNTRHFNYVPGLRVVDAAVL